MWKVPVLLQGLFYFWSMNIILFDHEELKENLLPLTYTRPVSRIRCGIQTIAEKWENVYNSEVIDLCGEPLGKHLNKELPKGLKLYINASVLPNEDIIQVFDELNDTEGIQKGDILLAYKSTENFDIENLSTQN